MFLALVEQGCFCVNPACGGLDTWRGSRLAGGTRRVPRAGLPRAVSCILFLCFRARARGTSRKDLLARVSWVFASAAIGTFSGLEGTFSGLVGHFPGAIHKPAKSYPQTWFFATKTLVIVAKKVKEYGE